MDGKVRSCLQPGAEQVSARPIQPNHPSHQSNDGKFAARVDPCLPHLSTTACVTGAANMQHSRRTESSALTVAEGTPPDGAAPSADTYPVRVCELHNPWSEAHPTSDPIRPPDSQSSPSPTQFSDSLSSYLLSSADSRLHDQIIEEAHVRQLYFHLCQAGLRYASLDRNHSPAHDSAPSQRGHGMAHATRALGMAGCSSPGSASVPFFLLLAFFPTFCQHIKRACASAAIGILSGS